ncbi:hypothetical protein EDEG_01374 [Edhazardia aedis USNM 41457]|uniref:Uncharacterized protein n=1 Tax=Edhazardia aedis (strain USNM 41457) TaxID=1003232 RepID=J8ZXH0_EDHAE|nr:hypothetical protein EDEG_01374 [Edhazardia aedis USNM 41457]|eukprot:EJW04383.1 hypothetical protein EDEG_01374 [Edhazardia aedis USNM 41457]
MFFQKLFLEKPGKKSIEKKFDCSWIQKDVGVSVESNKNCGINKKEKFSLLNFYRTNNKTKISIFKFLTTNNISFMYYHVSKLWLKIFRLDNGSHNKLYFLKN